MSDPVDSLARLSQLKAENERLRAALRELAESFVGLGIEHDRVHADYSMRPQRDEDELRSEWNDHDVVRRARAALAESGGGG